MITKGRSKSTDQFRQHARVVFTDLDGTLLDHTTYTWQPAASALELLSSEGVPVILCSSKTGPEIHQLHKAMGLDAPFIAENGAALFFPKPFSAAGNYTDLKPSHFAPEEVNLWTESEAEYPRMTECLYQLREEHGFSFISFQDMSAEQVADYTGLSLEQAKLAKQRAATEPLVWHGDDGALAQFKKKLSEWGYRLIKGGRFYHVMPETDKVHAMSGLLDYYQHHIFKKPCRSIALGDSENDRAMLEAADVAVVIQKKSGEWMRINRRHSVLYSEEPGPAGWAKAISQILSDD